MTSDDIEAGAEKLLAGSAALCEWSCSCGQLPLATRNAFLFPLMLAGHVVSGLMILGVTIVYQALHPQQPPPSE